MNPRALAHASGVSLALVTTVPGANVRSVPAGSSLIVGASFTVPPPNVASTGERVTTPLSSPAFRSAGPTSNP